MSKVKKILTNTRIVIVLIFILMALFAIQPSFNRDGVAIRSVAINTSAALGGIESPSPTSTPMSKEVILKMNNIDIKDISDYYGFVEDLKPNRTIHIKTNKGLYKLTTDTNDLGLTVYNAPTTNIRKGLDLQGGTRVMLQPEEFLNEEEMKTLMDNMEERINVYGLSDIVIKEVGDLSGNQYIMVEIPGAKAEEIKELISKQGKFEATIGNETVFTGSKKDITYVGRSATEARIENCVDVGNQWNCKFSFAISLSPEAAERQAFLTKDLEVITENNNEYLSEQLILYLDDVQFDELNIGSDLKGRAVTEISISGPGSGITQEEAVINTQKNMDRLRTILKTGSLPVKLNVVKTDTISPLFGEEYLKNSIFIGLLALLSVGIVSFIRYRRLKITIPMLLTSMIEVVLLLGFAATMSRFMTIDLAAIAGIIIVIGTSVDHQIVITDGVLSKGEETSDWKKRIKNAFFIIMAAYFTTMFAMFPLLWSGAGLLKGFALTTIIGVSIGVLITRPAYASVIEELFKE